MNAPYLLIPLSLILLILYGISYLFSRLGIIPGTVHRRIWNYALLATFLVSAILGFLMAVQINYRLEVPWTEIVLKWHVNFGIAMSIVGLFHLFWHVGYYIPMKSGKKRRHHPDGGRWESPVWQHILVFMIGFSGIAFQTFMIRELPGLFQGNELLLSVILFIWLLITGTGALAGNLAKPFPDGNEPLLYRRAALLAGSMVLLPLLLVPLMYYCRSLLFAPGIEAGPLGFAGFALLILLPFCFMNGFSFTWATRVFSPSGLSLRKAYAMESAGGAAAGLLTTLAIIAGVFTMPGTGIVEKLFHPNDEILATRTGPAGRLTVTGNGGQINLFENGVLMQSSGNSLVNQEMAHFAMAQHENPLNVLVLGGLLSGIDAELALYRCSRIDFIEPDPSLATTAEKLNISPVVNANVRHIGMSPERWIRRSDTRYDIVLIMLPGPQTLGLNRFFTAGFFQYLKQAMAPGAVLSVLMPGTANYVSEEAIRTIGPVAGALRESFTQVQIFPGENSYLLAADHTFRTDIPQRLTGRGIAAPYIEGYFNEELFTRRMQGINEAIAAETSVNSVFEPKAFLGLTAWWLGRFPSAGIWIIAAVLLLVLGFGFLPGNRTLSSMFLLGAAGSGLQIILMFLLQLSAGSVYLLGGLLLSSFMAGLAAGSSNRIRNLAGKAGKSPNLIIVLFCLITASTVPAALWIALPGGLILIKSSLVIILSFLAALLTGLFFSIQSEIRTGMRDAGMLYAFDLAGGALGALAFPMVIVPICGLLTAAGIVSGSGILILIILNTFRK